MLGFNSVGLFFFYWGEIQLCKIKADEYSDADFIPARSLTVFSSNNKDIKLVNDNEIFADGKMYDIIKTATSKGITSYFTLSDEEEDSYVQSLRDWEKGNSQEPSLPGKIINVHLAKYFIVSKYSTISCVFSLDFYSNVKTVSDSFFYRSPLQNVISPPPDKSLS